MRTTTNVTLILLWLAVPALAQSPFNRTPLAENAALQYWQAFSQLPPAESEHDKIYDQLYTISPSDPAAARLFESSRNSVMYLRRGRELSQCDWGLDYSDGMSLLLPHLAKARDLARLAALDARRDLERGDYKSARNTLHAIMVLGRHVRRDPVMIGQLVGVGIEDMAINAAVPYLPDWKLPYSEAKTMLDKLPPGTKFAESLDAEKTFMAEWIVRKLRDEEKRQPGAWQPLWKSLFTGTEIQPPEVESAEAAIKLVEDLLPVYYDLERFMSLPQNQFDAQYPAFKQQTKARHPLAGLLLPAIDQVRSKQKRYEARLAMLLAAIAVVESGPAQLAGLPDPLDVGSLEYRPLEKGFELKSKVHFEGQPVTLTIGHRK